MKRPSNEPQNRSQIKNLSSTVDITTNLIPPQNLAILIIEILKVKKFVSPNKLIKKEFSQGDHRQVFDEYVTKKEQKFNFPTEKNLNGLQGLALGSFQLLITAGNQQFQTYIKNAGISTEQFQFKKLLFQINAQVFRYIVAETKSRLKCSVQNPDLQQFRFSLRAIESSKQLQDLKFAPLFQSKVSIIMKIGSIESFKAYDQSLRQVNLNDETCQSTYAQEVKEQIQDVKENNGQVYIVTERRYQPKGLKESPLRISILLFDNQERWPKRAKNFRFSAVSQANKHDVTHAVYRCRLDLEDRGILQFICKAELFAQVIR